MAAVAQLKAILGIDNKAYKAGVRESEGVTQRFQRTLSTVGKALAGAFSVAAVMRFTKHLVDFASEIRHAADNLNVTTDELQAMNAVALKSGVSIDQVNKALAKTKDAQGNLAAGGEDAKRYADALDTLGINAAKFMRASPAEAIAMIGRAYKEGGEQAAAFSAISDILGERIGPRLVSMLKEIGDDGMQTVIDKAKEAGMVLEDDFITKLELAGTRIEQFKLKATVGFGDILETWSKIFSGDFSGIGKRVVGTRAKLTSGAMRAAEDAGLIGSASKDSTSTGTVNVTAIEKAERIRQRYNNQRISGEGVDVGSLQRTGGFIGQSRAGVAQVDRRLKLQEKSNELQRELVKLAQDSNVKLEDIQNALTGGSSV